MQPITNIETLNTLYGAAVPKSLTKVQKKITPLYHKWISASRFVVLSTIGPEGTDASPRGDNGPVVRIADPQTLLLPDWRGNNRIDSLRNIVRDNRVSLMFMITGCNNVVRVNGTAFLTADDTLRQSFARKRILPATVAVITPDEIYFQCAKALMRSNLWNCGDESENVPTAGEFVREVEEDFDAEGYDVGYAEYAKTRMW